MVDNVDELLEQLDEEQLLAIAMGTHDIDVMESNDPLSRFNHNNAKQQEFLNLTKPIQFFIGGNKAGKTATVMYKLARQLLGKDDKFPFEPPLQVWICGETLKVLGDTPLKELVKWLPYNPNGEYKNHWETKKVGQLIDHMYVWDEFGRKSELQFKPYNAKRQTFESANVHIALLDEECPEDVFKALQPRLSAKSGFIYCAMTPADGMTWTGEFLEGMGTMGALTRMGYVGVVRSDTRDNESNLPPGELERLMASYRDDPDEFARRIQGVHTAFKGKVYRVQADKFVDELQDTISWHMFDLHELPDLSKCRVFGYLDWGFADPCVYTLKVIDEDDSEYNLDGFYQSGLDATVQAEMIKEISDKWGLIPEVIVADNQILNRQAQKDALKPHITNIRDYYHETLGESWTYFRCEEMDKRNPQAAREKIKYKTMTLSKKTGKPKLRWSRDFCRKHFNEMYRIEYADAGDKEKTKGPDHAEAGERYFANSGISHAGFMTTKEVDELPDLEYYDPTPY